MWKFQAIAMNSLKINDLIQSSQSGVYFFNSTVATNISVWAKYMFYISPNLSYRYPTDAGVFTAHVWFAGE